MDKVKHYIVETILVVLLLLAAGAYLNKNREAKDLNTALLIAKDSTRHFRNKYGEQVAQTKVMQITNSQLKVDGESLGLEITKLKVQVGNLNKLVTAYQGVISARGTVDTVTRDSIVYLPGKPVIVYKNFNYTSKYLSLDGYFLPELNKFHTEYRYTSPILITISGHGNKLLGKASMEDPNARIDDQKVVLMDKREKRWYERKWPYMILGGVVAETLRQKLK